MTWHCGRTAWNTYQRCLVTSLRHAGMMLGLLWEFWDTSEFSRPGTLDRGQFCPQRTFSNVWRHFGLSQLEKVVKVTSILWTEARNAVLKCIGQPPLAPKRLTWPKMSIVVPRLRSPLKMKTTRHKNRFSKSIHLQISDSNSQISSEGFLYNCCTETHIHPNYATVR